MSETADSGNNQPVACTKNMSEKQDDWVCPTCGGEFASEMGLSVHHSKKHNKPITYFGLDLDQIGPAILCPTCDEGFFTKTDVKIHHKHAHDESIAGIETECHKCGEKFSRVPARVERAKRPFCSVECQNQWRKGEFRGKDSPNYDGGRDVIKCDYCGDEFEKYSSKADLSNNNFCSMDCKNDYRSENYTGQDSPNWQRVEFDCDNCGDSVWVYPTNLNYENHFCDDECFVQWQRRTAPDEGKHSVKHGSFWQKQRKRALKRDNYKCQNCGVQMETHRKKHGESLHIHHKTPARLFKSHAEAHKIDNLITLCAPCHMEAEWELRQRQSTTGRQSTLTEVFSQ